MTNKGLSALSESADSMTRELATALLYQIADNGSLKDIWTEFWKKIQVDCNVSGSKPVEVEADELPNKVEKISIEAEQIGDKVLKVSFTEYIGKLKKTTRIEEKPQGMIYIMMNSRPKTPFFLKVLWDGHMRKGWRKKAKKT